MSIKYNKIWNDEACFFWIQINMLNNVYIYKKYIQLNKVESVCS